MGFGLSLADGSSAVSYSDDALEMDAHLVLTAMCS
jgi:hypothetical protein